MYDFVLGSSSQIYDNELEYLIAVKHMLPRWLNSLPDGEFSALFELALKAAKEHPGTALVETGTGASTLALTWIAARYDCKAVTWDISGSKLSAMRQVCFEAFQPYIGDPIKYWTPIPWSSTCEYLGLSGFVRTGQKIAFSFHDSEHTWGNLSTEIEQVSYGLVNGGVVAIDDANLQWNHLNVGLLNTYRRKLGWEPLPESLAIEQSGEVHWKRALHLLEDLCGSVVHLSDSFKDAPHDDPYFEWFSTEFDIKVEMGTERDDSLNHRFDAFKIFDAPTARLSD